MAVVISAISADLIDINPESVEPSGNNSVVSNNLQVTLAKSEGKLVSPPTHFPVSPSGVRPSRPVTTPSVNPYRNVPKLAGSNPAGGGGGGGAADYEDQCPAPKKEKSEPSNYDYLSSSSSKKKKKSAEQCELDEKGKETAKKDFEKAIKEESKLNERRRKAGRGLLTVIFKGDLKLLAENDHLRDKFHHSPDLGSPLPATLSIKELARLSNPSLYEERLETFRNREILPETYVEQYGRDLRFEILSPDTKVKPGTFGANSEAKGRSKKIPGYIAYNDKTNFCAFFEQNGNLYKTGFIANASQQTDIEENSNLM